jgi:hypothetical protein
MAENQDKSYDSSQIILTLGYPSSAFLYKSTFPRLLIDGVGHPVPGWGTHRFAVSAGDHRLQVWVPYVLPRRAGLAQIDVTVPEHASVQVEYTAPTFTMAKGSIGQLGEQRSAGLSTVRNLNLLALVVVAVAVVVIVALG